MKILFLTPYPFHGAPSQRFRFEQYLELLLKNGIKYDLHPFTSDTDWKILQKPGRGLRKILILTKGILARVLLLFSSSKFDYVFIHRESVPIGPPVLEWIIVKILKKKIVYDFDDAIWTTDKLSESFFERLLRFRRKVSLVCKWSYKVSCGNDYLCKYALQFNTSVILNPTTIDTELLHNPTRYDINKNANEIIIGWTGTHSTLKYLYELEPVILSLEKKYKTLKFIVIADEKPALKLRSLHYIPWSMQSEIEDLLKIDIGIMPLPDDEWSKGKCGFKALQYMSLGIPAVALPVGINTKIIAHGIDGFLCSQPTEWIESLEALIVDKELRLKIGINARAKIVNQFSVSSNASNFLSLFQ